MKWHHGRILTSVIRSAASVATIAAMICILTGCNSGGQVDKYTVTDADRQAAKAGLGPDGKRVGATLPKDPHDSAAYGPDGKRMP